MLESPRLLHVLARANIYVVVAWARFLVIRYGLVHVKINRDINMRARSNGTLLTII